jgi:transcriptional regulator with XRE-family HTH domain
MTVVVSTFEAALYQAMRRRRLQLEMGQQEFSKKVGLSPRFWYKIEAGQVGLLVPRIVRAAEILGVAVSTLFYEAEQFLASGEFPELPLSATERKNLILKEKENAAMLDQLRRRDNSWCAPLTSKLCEAHEE